MTTIPTSNLNSQLSYYSHYKFTLIMGMHYIYVQQ